MDRIRESIAERRGHTDASIGAERSSADAAARTLVTERQRLLDDLIERDRVAADAQMMRKLEGAAWRRTQGPGSSLRGDVRHLAKRGPAAELEPEVRDQALHQHRERAEASVGLVTHEHQANVATLRMRRHQFDDQLSAERDSADVAVNALVTTKVALAQAQKAQSRRGEVLGMVAHDLRTPIGIIVLNTQCIDELATDTVTHEAAQDVLRAAARMERMLSDLLDLARIDAGTLHVIKGEYDIGTFLAELNDTYRPLFEARGMSFIVERPDRTIIARFDHDRIVQVLSNLLGNAIKFMSGGGTATLRLEEHGEWVEFILSDDGPGIRPDVLPDIFKPFRQADLDTRRGLGLGLHICEQIVNGHGGRIWVESEFGNGATFRFTLPAR